MRPDIETDIGKYSPQPCRCVCRGNENVLRFFEKDTIRAPPLGRVHEMIVFQVRIDAGEACFRWWFAAIKTFSRHEMIAMTNRREIV